MVKIASAAFYIFSVIVEVLLFTVTEKNHGIFADKSFSINTVAEFDQVYFTALPAVLRRVGIEIFGRGPRSNKNYSFYW